MRNVVQLFSAFFKFSAANAILLMRKRNLACEQQTSGRRFSPSIWDKKSILPPFEISLYALSMVDKLTVIFLHRHAGHTQK